MARLFLSRHYRRSIMIRQRVGQNRLDKIIKDCNDQGREASMADMDREGELAEEDNVLPEPDEVMDTLDWTWLTYWRNNRGKFDLRLVFPELSQEALDELEEEQTRVR